jgi:hypothetical protein
MNHDQLGIAAMDLLVSRPDDSAYVFAWLRKLMRALAKGLPDGVELLEDGRARISVVYPSEGDLHYAWLQFQALRAMGAEDAAADEK